MIFLTGSTGFVGKNLISYFNNKNKIIKYKRNSSISITGKVVIHLAGLAHDLKKENNFEKYYENNTKLTSKLFDAFLDSNAEVFIMLSSVKAVLDKVEGKLKENNKPKPITHYGKSKLLAEKYILSKNIPKTKRVYILRPCMIHGPGNKGNLNILFKYVSIGLPWIFGSFKNKRSYCSIDNFTFVINELMYNNSIPSGIYNLSDDESISTKDLVLLISETLNQKIRIWNIPTKLVIWIVKFGDLFNLPLNTESFEKLTGSYIVSNKKIKKVIGKSFPVSAKMGLLKTFHYFKTKKPLS